MFRDFIAQTETKVSIIKAVSIHVFTFLVVALLAGICAPSLYADIYSWTDQNGVKHFSNVPPPPSTQSNVDVKREYVYD
jgi:hypothetical protein